MSLHAEGRDPAGVQASDQSRPLVAREAGHARDDGGIGVAEGRQSRIDVGQYRNDDEVGLRRGRQLVDLSSQHRELIEHVPVDEDVNPIDRHHVEELADVTFGPVGDEYEVEIRLP